MAAIEPSDTALYSTLIDNCNTISTDITLRSEDLVICLNTIVDQSTDKNDLDNGVQPNTGQAALSSLIGPALSSGYYPEGGYGWIVLIATFVISFWTIGIILTWGVYQEYFLTSQTFPNTDAKQFALVAGVLTGCACVGAPAIVYLISLIGLPVVLALGVSLSGFGILMASFATQYWHLHLTIAVPFGLGTCILYFTSITILAQYFCKRRAFVTGLAASGSGIGSAVMAPLQRWMMSQLGFRSSTRIVGCTMIICLSLAVYFVKPFVHPPQLPQSLANPSLSSLTNTISASAIQGKVQDGEIDGDMDQPGRVSSNPVNVNLTYPSTSATMALDISVFKHVHYLLLIQSSFVFTLTYLVPVVVLPSYSTSIGLTPLQGASLISASSGATVFTRIAFGYIADRIGIFNTILVCQFVTTLSCFALWLPASGYVLLLVFMTVYGGCAGALFVLLPVAASKSVDFSQMASAISFVFFAYTAGSALGPPIAHVIVEASGGRFLEVIVYLGVLNVIGFVTVAVIRFKEQRRLFFAL